MKRIERIEMVEKPVVKFIAKDGTEFDHEHACMEYEHTKAIEHSKSSLIYSSDNTRIMEGEENQRNKEEIPIWEKITLTIDETALLFRIGQNKLRNLVHEQPDADFVIWNGYVLRSNENCLKNIFINAILSKNAQRMAEVYIILGL